MTDVALEARRDLAAVLRWSDRFGLSEGICNHFSYAIDDDHFLVNPWGYHWSQIRASDLVLVDHAGNVVEGDGEIETSALSIHSGIHRGHPNARCVLHTHMSYATAIACLEGGRLLMVSQNAARYFDDVAYMEDFGGLALDESEGDSICRAFDGKRILFHANHGVMVVGETIAQAFDDLYYLERACKVQVLAQSTGQPLKIIDDETARLTAAQFREYTTLARDHLSALRQVLDRECPEYLD